MSKTSYVLIGVMIAAIAWMAGLRGYRAYEAYVARQEEQNTSVFTFQNVPLLLQAPAAQALPAPVPYPSSSKEIYLTEEPLSPEKEQEQAVQTVHSILADYGQEEALQRFGRDLTEATHGEITGLESLSGPDLARLAKEHPEVSAVIARHLQDPEFTKLIRDVFSNPQYVRSIAVLQGGGKTPAAAENPSGGKN